MPIPTEFTGNFSGVTAPGAPCSGMAETACTGIARCGRKRLAIPEPGEAAQ